jgi:hypothetical protein
LDGIELCDATLATGTARILKTPDEIACLRHSQRINEVAMYDVEAALRPGVRQNELSGIFLRRVFELGASSSIIDPIWNLTPLSIADGSLTANADVGFPLASTDSSGKATSSCATPGSRGWATTRISARPGSAASTRDRRPPNVSATSGGAR